MVSRWLAVLHFGHGFTIDKRHLEDIQRRLCAARESLAVLEEQVDVWNDALDDARIRVPGVRDPAAVPTNIATCRVTWSPPTPSSSGVTARSRDLAATA